MDPLACKYAFNQNQCDYLLQSWIHSLDYRGILNLQSEPSGLELFQCEHAVNHDNFMNYQYEEIWVARHFLDTPRNGGGALLPFLYRWGI